jgi:hypothetical protein
MAFFYAILLVGFAYVWYRGDLDWVRAVSAERAASPASRAGRPQLWLTKTRMARAPDSPG